MTTYKTEDIIKGIGTLEILAENPEHKESLENLVEALKTSIHPLISETSLYEVGNDAGLYSDEIEAIITYLDAL